MTNRQNAYSNHDNKYQHVRKGMGDGTRAEMSGQFPFYETTNLNVWRGATHHVMTPVEAVFPGYNCSSWDWVLNAVWHPSSAAGVSNNKDFIAMIEVKQGSSGIQKVRCISVTAYHSCQCNIGSKCSSNSRCFTPSSSNFKSSLWKAILQTISTVERDLFHTVLWLIKSQDHHRESNDSICPYTWWLCKEAETAWVVVR